MRWKDNEPLCRLKKTMRMMCGRYPSHIILGNIVIRTTTLAYARRVEEIAKAELAKNHITSGIVNVDGLRIAWSVLSQRRQP
jgi:hypothetical protein